jgi:hypothetical protein
LDEWVDPQRVDSTAIIDADQDMATGRLARP